MNQVIDICKNCGSNTLIVNKRYYLCQDCNWHRLHPDGDMKEERRRKKQALLRNTVKPAKGKSIKTTQNTYLCSDGTRVTQAQIDGRYKDTILLIDQERDAKCESCKRNDKPLSHSHIISRKRAKELGKTELIWDDMNILLECYGNRKSCHETTEKGLLFCKEHYTFELKKEMIKEYDKEAFNKLEL